MSFSYFTAGKLSLFNMLSFFLEFFFAFFGHIFSISFSPQVIFLFKRFLEVYFISVNAFSSHSLHNYSWHCELNSWVGGRVSFLKLQSHLPSCTFLSITNPLIPHTCPELVSAQGLAPSTRVCLWLVLELHRDVQLSHFTPKYSISARLWSSTPLFNCCLLSQVLQVPWASVSTLLIKFLIFLLNILKGTPASERASKWRNWWTTPSNPELDPYVQTVRIEVCVPPLSSLLLVWIAGSAQSPCVCRSLGPLLVLSTCPAQCQFS